MSSAAVVLLVLSLAAEPAQPIEWAADRQVKCSVVNLAGPASPHRRAADEVVSILSRMASAPFERVDELPEGDGPAIVFCDQSHSALKRVQPAIPKPGADSFTIATRGARVYVQATDDAGAWYGAYALLEKLGCRFMAPSFDYYAGEHSLVPRVDRIVWPGRPDVVETPKLEIRKIYVEEGLSHDLESLRRIIAWMPTARFNVLVVPTDYQGHGRVCWDNWREVLTPELQVRGITIEVGGHGYQNFVNARQNDGRLFTEHPEWFGMDEQGQRTAAPSRVFCSSNPQAVDWLTAHVIEYLEDRPEIEVFDFWPPDGAKWCTCPECAKLGSPVERHAKLVNAMTEALHREQPGVRLECIAYSSYLEPPTTELPHSLLVDLCPIAQSFERQIDDPASATNAKYAAALKGWKKVHSGPLSVYSYYRKYAWNSLPVQIPHYMQNDLRFYVANGARGISTYAEPGDWATYELNHYVLGRLAWNPEVDVDALIHEFCEARYGSAEQAGYKGLETLAQVVRHACSLPGTSLKSPEQYDAWLKDVKAARGGLRSWLADRNVQRLDLMLDYAEHDLGLRRMEAAKEPIAKRTKAFNALVKRLQANADEGVFLWMPARLESGSMARRYGLEIKAVTGRR